MICKKIMKYYSVHPIYNSVVSFLIGAGVGVLIASSFIGPHPVRWGVFLIVLGLLGKVYSLISKK